MLRCRPPRLLNLGQIACSRICRWGFSPTASFAASLGVAVRLKPNLTSSNAGPVWLQAVRLKARVMRPPGRISQMMITQRQGPRMPLRPMKKSPTN